MPWILAAALLLAGCGAPHPQGQSPAGSQSASESRAAVQPVAAAALPTYHARLVRQTFPQRPALTSVRMDSQSRGWAILQLLHGTAVASTTDGGATWSTLLVTPRSAVQVDSPNAATAFVLENGCSQGNCAATSVIASFDGGRTWQAVFASSRFTASAISFPTPEVGFIAGSVSGGGQVTGALYTTTDGGLTWTLLTTPCAYSGSNAQTISFLGADQGFLICGAPPSAGEQPKTFYTTRDGGVSWTEVSTTAGAVQTLNGLPIAGYVHSMFFLSGETGFIGLDRGGIYMTRDGGQDWQAVFGQALPTSNGQAFSVGFSDQMHGWMLAGDGPPLYTTADGGLTWQLVYPPLSPNAAISFLSGQLGYAAGWAYDGAAVLRTEDGGSTWTDMGDAPDSLSALEVLGPGQIMALGQAALYVSLDGGRTWEQEPFELGWYPAALGMATVQRGWVIGYTPAVGRQLFFTQNTGDSWRALQAPFTPSAVAPLGGDVVLATGTAKVTRLYLPPDRQGRKPIQLRKSAPYIWRSADAGLHWLPRSLPDWRPQQGMPIGMRVGNAGLVWLWSAGDIWLSGDGGQSFRRISLRGLGALTDVSFINGAQGWLLTTSGALYATDDGGQVWQEVASSVSF